MREIDYVLEEIPISSIDTGVRYRADFNGLEELAADIDQFGLHHPILVLDKSYLPEDYGGNHLDQTRGYLLLAGERRYKAVLQLNWETVPCKVTQRVLNKWEIRVIELHENLQRKSMSPVEEAKLKEAIHETYQAIYGDPGRGGHGGKQGHSLADTAKAIGVDKGNLSRELKIAKYADAIPEVNEAKTKSEALKLISQFEQKIAREELARREEARRKAKDKSQQFADPRLILMERYQTTDYFAGMKQLKSRTIDLIELDPDWGINFKASREKSKTAEDYVELPPEEYEAELRSYLKEAHRVLKDNSWLIVWYSLEMWHQRTWEIILDAGFQCSAMPGLWVHESGATTTPAFRLGQSVEAFFYARKGSPRIGRMGRNQAFHYRLARANERSHPAEKPVELYTDILNTFIGERKGASVIVGFAGSGNAILAGENLGHNVVGFDSSAPYRDTFVLRVKEGEYGNYKTYKDAP